MFDHVGIAASDLAVSERFYRTVLSALGVEPSHADPGLVEWEDWAMGPTDREHPVTRGLHVGFRAPDRDQFSGPDFSFSVVRDDRPLTQHVHLAFTADTDATVRAFHAAALAEGYEDHGAPGERAVYHPGYYGAFVLDPDGYNVELVNHNR
jgi:catechol 2,3-dioxygenase-like lactoylglutathione lyase family enzyme